MLLPRYFPFSMQSDVVVAWAHQDCSKPLDLSKQRAAKIKQLVELEKKLSVREEEIKNNAIDLVAKFKELEKAQAEIGLLKGQLARLHEEGRLLRLQLDEAKAEAANAVFEYQSSEEMAALKQTFHDEGYEEAAEAFAYTAMVTHPNLDLGFLGEHLANQTAAWRSEHRAAQPLANERPASPTATRPPSSAFEPSTIPFPPHEVHPEHVIEGDQEPAVRVAESDGSVEQINNPDGVLDRQEE